MNSDESIDVLFQLLEQWRTLTHAEAESIRKLDWQNLDRLQSEKTQLQEAVRIAERAVFAGAALPPERRSRERKRLQETAQELKRLEIENRDLLMRLLEETDAQLKSGSRTISELREIQKAYGSGPETFWEDFS